MLSSLGFSLWAIAPAARMGSTEATWGVDSAGWTVAGGLAGLVVGPLALRPPLATLTEITQEGSRIQVWTQIDVQGMQADYWEATKPSPQVLTEPQASTAPAVISKGEMAHSYQAFPDACRLQNGDILVVFYAGYGHVSISADDFLLGARVLISSRLPLKTHRFPNAK